MTALTLSELYIYPVKSAAGIAVNAARLTTRGLQYDRQWMVVDEQGKFLTQRRFPQMALIEVNIGEQLQINAPDMAQLSVPLMSESDERINVEVWGDVCEAIALPETKSWFTQVIGIDCQLVYMPDNAHRPTDHGKLKGDYPVSFADAYPYLLISEASLAELNEKLAAKDQSPITMQRFRPNLVIQGVGQPHEEDTWQQVQVGGAVLDLPKLCARCSIPNVNPQTGERTKEPTSTLATYRAWDKGIWFGINGVQKNLETTGITLRIGDVVEVLATHQTNDRNK